MLRISLPAGLGRAAVIGALALPMFVPLPAFAQDSTTAPSTAPAEETAPVSADPMDVFRQAFDECLAAGVEGADCAEQAKAALLAVMSGTTTPLPATSGTESGEAPDAAMNGGGQTNTSSGADGQVSSGGSEREGRGNRENRENRDNSDAGGDESGDDSSGAE